MSTVHIQLHSIATNKKNKGRIMTFRHLDFYIVYIVHCTFTLHCLPNNNNNNRDVTSGFDNYNN